MKPDNICIGSTNDTANKIYLIGMQITTIPGIAINLKCSLIYLIDFAFSEPVYNENGKPNERVETDQFDGTPEYMARGPLNGFTHMRKDDFISLGIVMLELNGADISWMELDLEDETIWDAMVAVLKYWDEYGLEPAYETSENADFFRTYFDYLDTVNSSAAPDYNRLREILMMNLTEDDIKRGELAFMDNIKSKKASKRSKVRKRN